MSEIGRRWRLMLGEYSSRQLPALNPSDIQRDDALQFLYGRLYTDRGLAGAAPTEQAGDGSRDRHAGNSGTTAQVVDWLDALHASFPDEVVQELTAEAVDRFGLTELLNDPRALDRIEPDLEMLKLLLSLKSEVQPAAVHAVRRLVAQVVDELMERLRSEIASALSGRVNPQSRTRRPTGVVDALRTIEANLGTWDQERERLLIEHVTFHRRTKLRYPWEIVLCIDQSGSMVGSVIHSAVLAGVLASLPGVTVRLVVFDTTVVDLSGHADDPVETLMSVRLGGGTLIGQALTYCEQQVTNPSRTIVALITDFYEGGPAADLLGSVARLAEAGVTLMGLAALDDGAGPAYDRRMAEKVVAAGMPVAAMTPTSFAQWAAGVMR